MANSLWPAYVVINYTSAWGAHKMTIPTKSWDIGIGTHGFGGYLGWDGTTPNEADDMINDLVTALQPFALTTMTFNDATIYQVSAPGGFAFPVTVVPLAVAGTSTSTVQAKAVQETWSFRTAIFGKARLTLIDCPASADFEPVLPAAFGANDLAVVAEFTDVTKAWSGRDNNRPTTVIRKTFTLNDKIRREYGMT